MKKIIILIVLSSISLYSQYSENVIATRADIAFYRTAVIKVERGINWKQSTSYGMLSPQIAIWIQDVRGNFLQNIYVTRSFGQQNMLGTPPDFSSVFRRIALPFWHKKNYIMTKEYITKNNILPDSVSKPTPPSSFTVETRIINTINEAYVYLEINHLEDTNKTYKTINGQPSLIYRALVDFTKAGEVYDFELFAMTDIFREGIYTTNISGITTADKIVSEVSITILK